MKTAKTKKCKHTRINFAVGKYENDTFSGLGGRSVVVVQHPTKFLWFAKFLKFDNITFNAL